MYECNCCDRFFGSSHSLHQHQSSAAGHPYCIPCRRLFMNFNNLNQHQHSRIHVGSRLQCPWCKQSYSTASGVTIHLESGSCSSGMNLQEINDTVRRLDRNHVITRPMITMPGYENIHNNTAGERAWNGNAYECYICPREFCSLPALNQHMQSPAHEQAMYKCPKRDCGRTYKVLSGLIQHVESESCGFMQFGAVQRQAQTGVKNMVGRMIAGGSTSASRFEEVY